MHYTTRKFWKYYDTLPENVQDTAKQSILNKDQSIVYVYTIVPSGDFCSHVCSDAANKSSKQQRDRESTQRKAAEAAEYQSVEKHIAELARDRQRLQLEILHREELEARSLGISRL